MAALTTAVVSRTPLNQGTGGGGAPVAVNSGGDTFSAGPDVYLRFTNTGSAATVTILTPGKYKGIALAGEQITVPATTGDVEVGPYPADPYTADGSTVSMTYSATPTGLKVAVKKYAA